MCLKSASTQKPNISVREYGQRSIILYPESWGRHLTILNSGYLTNILVQRRVTGQDEWSCFITTKCGHTHKKLCLKFKNFLVFPYLFKMLMGRAATKKTGPQRTQIPWESLGHSTRLKTKGWKKPTTKQNTHGNAEFSGGRRRPQWWTLALWLSISIGTVFCYVNCFSPPPYPLPPPPPHPAPPNFPAVMSTDGTITI